MLLQAFNSIQDQRIVVSADVKSGSRDFQFYPRSTDAKYLVYGVYGKTFNSIQDQLSLRQDGLGLTNGPFNSIQDQLYSMMNIIT